MLRRDYFGRTKSIPWLLMPWRRKEQPWYWLCKMGRSFTSKRKNFNNLLHLIVEKWLKKQTYGFIIIDWFISSSIDNLSKVGAHPSISGIILCMRPANERRRYNVTSSLIGYTHTLNDPSISSMLPCLGSDWIQFSWPQMLHLQYYKI